MNGKGYMIFNIVLAIAMIFVFVMVLITDVDSAKEHISSVIGVILSATLCIIGYQKSHVSSVNRKNKQYEETCTDILKGVFGEDAKNYKKLEKAVFFVKHRKYRKALRLLKGLEKACVCTRDYVAVYTFKAICYTKEKKDEQAVECYKEVLKYDMSNVNALLHLGLYYKRMGRMDEAYEAYTNALRYNPQNACAHNNMACFFIQMNKPEEALSHALKAIELDKEVYQAMSAAAIAYQMLGDEENAGLYFEMYGIHGGKMPLLKKRLDEVENIGV